MWYQGEDEEDEDLMFSPALLARRASESWINAPPIEVNRALFYRRSSTKVARSAGRCLWRVFDRVFCCLCEFSKIDRPEKARPCRMRSVFLRFIFATLGDTRKENRKRAPRPSTRWYISTLSCRCKNNQPLCTDLDVVLFSFRFFIHVMIHVSTQYRINKIARWSIFWLFFSDLFYCFLWSVL